MRKLYENFKIFHFQKRIVSTETISRNTVLICNIQFYIRLWIRFKYILAARQKYKKPFKYSLKNNQQISQQNLQATLVYQIDVRAHLIP